MRKKVIYRCSNCGNESIKWMGLCSECNSWNSFQEVLLEPKLKDNLGKTQQKKKE